jgi:TorA maturation chaperone TorD
MLREGVQSVSVATTASVFEQAVLELRQRAGEFRFLSRLLAAPPDKWLLADAETVGLLEAGWELRIDAIQVEFSRLFSVPGPDAIAVHQSTYTDVLRIKPAEAGTLVCGALFAGGEYPGYLGGPSCQEARRCYAASGFEPPAQEMPDHIAVQLDFLAYLFLAEAQAIAEQRWHDASAWRDRREQFRAQFLGRWLDSFAREVAANLLSEFYRRVGQRLRELV